MKEASLSVFLVWFGVFYFFMLSPFLSTVFWIHWFSHFLLTGYSWQGILCFCKVIKVLCYMGNVIYLHSLAKGKLLSTKVQLSPSTVGTWAVSHCWGRGTSLQACWLPGLKMAWNCRDQVSVQCLNLKLSRSSSVHRSGKQHVLTDLHLNPSPRMSSFF